MQFRIHSSFYHLTSQSRIHTLTSFTQNIHKLSIKKFWIAFKLKNNEDLFLHHGTDQLTQSTKDHIFNSKFDNMKSVHL